MDGGICIENESDRIDIKAVSPITEKEYFVRGNTAMLGAIGRAIHKIGGTQKHTAEDHRAEKALFVISMDGMENASREYTHKKNHTSNDRNPSTAGNLSFSARTSTPWKLPTVLT